MLHRGKQDRLFLSREDAEKLIASYKARRGPVAVTAEAGEAATYDRYGYFYVIQLVPEALPNRVKVGGPDVLRWEDIPTPVPGPGEVLVRVHAVSVNRTLDLQVRQDGGNYGVTLPLVLGCDPSGIVVEVRPGVELVKVNDRVAIFGGVSCGRCPHCTKGNHRRCAERKMLGVQCWGGHAEFVKIPAVNCVLVPEALTFAQAAVIARHFSLAFGECHLAELKQGEWALVMGAAGGLGSCLVQVAKTLGAHVVAAAGTDQRVQVAVSLGADFGVNYRRDDLQREIARITAGRGVDVVFENIGDPAL